MAIIYDISSGKVIQDYEIIRTAGTPAQERGHCPDLQPALAQHSPESEPPCTAYMALLQRILKDL